MRNFPSLASVGRGVLIVGVAVALVVGAGVPASSLSGSSKVVADAVLVASYASAPSVLDAVDAERSALSDAVSVADTAVSEKVAGSVSTAKLTELAAAVDVAVKDASTELPFEPELDAYRYLGELPLRAEVANDRIAHASQEAEVRVVALSVAVKAWEAELAAEKDRIRIAKEKAAAAAAARAAAAAAAARGGSSYTGSSSGGGGGSSVYARVAQIAAGLPFSFRFSIGGCPQPGAYACYDSWKDTITITPGRAVQSTCKVRSALAHEYRHQWQYKNGKFVFKNHVLMNRDALEADAYAFGYSYGC